MGRSSYGVPARRDGRAAVAAALGACVGLSGIDHGIFEVLQGSARTPGLFIPAIGPQQQMWVHGTEDAFTVVPDLLTTGVLAILLGVLTLVWSIGFVDRRRGATGLLVLGLLTFTVGGGIGMLAFLLFGWAVARRIGRPVPHRAWVPAGLRVAVTRSRPALVAAGMAQYVVAVAIAITGVVPGVSDPDTVLAVCWALLAGALATFGVALVGAGVHEGGPTPEPVPDAPSGDDARLGGRPDARTEPTRAPAPLP